MNKTISELDNKGKAEEINGSKELLQWVMKLIPDRQGNLYVLKTGGTVEVLNSSLGSIKTWEKDSYYDISLDENDNLILLRGRNLIQKFDNNNVVSNAAREYESSHPDVNIEINDLRKLTIKEWIQRLNTEMLAGKGSDIIYDELLNYCSYKEKGLLVNLEELISRDSSFNINDYSANMIDASRVGNELYTMPVSYRIDLFLVNNKLLEQKDIVLSEDINWEQLYNMINEANSKSEKKFYILPKMTYEFLFNWMMCKDVDYYVEKGNKLARFDSEEFIHELELVKRIAEGGLLHPDIDAKAIIRSDGEIAPEDILFILIQLSSYGSIFDIGTFYEK